MCTQRLEGKKGLWVDYSVEGKVCENIYVFFSMGVCRKKDVQGRKVESVSLYACIVYDHKKVVSKSIAFSNLEYRNIVRTFI